MKYDVFGIRTIDGRFELGLKEWASERERVSKLIKAADGTLLDLGPFGEAWTYYCTVDIDPDKPPKRHKRGAKK